MKENIILLFLKFIFIISFPIMFFSMFFIWNKKSIEINNLWEKERIENEIIFKKLCNESNWKIFDWRCYLTKEKYCDYIQCLNEYKFLKDNFNDNE